MDRDIEPWSCPACGGLAGRDARYCPSCGKSLETASNAPAKPATAAAIVPPLDFEVQRPVDVHPTGSRFATVFSALIAVLGIGAFSIVVYAMLTGFDAGRAVPQGKYQHDFSALYRAYGVPAIPDGAMDDIVFANLLRLEKEKCDWPALYAVASRLTKEDEKRLAANLYLGFPKSCDTQGGAQREAANLLYGLKDFQKSRDLFADLVSRFPTGDLDWYHKGLAEKALGLNAAALDSYTNMISLTRDQAKLGEWVFTEMSEIYVAMGRYCEAMTPIATYVSLDPSTRQNTRTQQMLDTFSAKGQCTSFASGADSFPVLNSGVIPVRVSINGIEGKFWLDTGASFVALNPDFAARAGIKTTGVQKFMTANGETDGLPGRAEKIRLGRLSASDVPVVVLTTPMGQADGLLGRSFLSRFDMTVAKNRVSLKTR